jgi:protein-disulfide isomerase
VIAQLLERFEGQMRYVVRHLPLTDVAPTAELAAEAAEAAGAQGAFWPMYDAFVRPAGPGTLGSIHRVAHGLGLDLDRLFDDLDRHAYAGRVANDVRSADASGVTGTPTLFIDGRRWSGPIELEALCAAVTARVHGSDDVSPDLDGACVTAVAA